MNKNNEKITCAHCAGTGTCKNGPNGTSCVVCIRKNKLYKASGNKPKKEYEGIVCSVCKGRGIILKKGTWLKKNFPPILAVMIVYFSLALIMIHPNDNLVAFAGTLIGSITGYYFGGKSKGG
jgi:hypothetical protein